MDTEKKKKRIFLWDLHEVVFQKNLFQWVKLGLQFDRKLDLIKKFDCTSAQLIGFHLLEKIRLSNRQVSAQELIDLAKKNNNQTLVDFTMRLCCAYTPINETVKIIKGLQQLGYEHHIGSNIARHVYDIFKYEYQDIFALFNAKTVVESTHNNQVIKKPNPRFFKAHVEKYAISPEQVIFIDDRKSNVYAAQSVGMTGIHFTGPGQLKRDLMNRGFML